MTSFFHDRDYPEYITSSAETKVKAMSRDQALRPATANKTDRVPLVLTYHPLNIRIAKIIQKNFNIIRADPTTYAIFPSPPLLSYRKDTNLRNTLVHSQFTPKQDNSSMGPCHCPICKTCKFTYSTNIIRGPKGEISIKVNFSCTTKDVIY